MGESWLTFARDFAKLTNKCMNNTPNLNHYSSIGVLFVFKKLYRKRLFTPFLIFCNRTAISRMPPNLCEIWRIPTKPTTAVRLIFFSTTCMTLVIRFLHRIGSSILYHDSPYHFLQILTLKLKIFMRYKTDFIESLEMVRNIFLSNTYI